MFLKRYDIDYPKFFLREISKLLKINNRNLNNKKLIYNSIEKLKDEIAIINLVDLIDENFHFFEKKAFDVFNIDFLQKFKCKLLHWYNDESIINEEQFVSLFLKIRDFENISNNSVLDIIINFDKNLKI